MRSRDHSDGFGAFLPPGFRRAGAFFFAAAAADGRFFGRARVAVTMSTTVTVASPVFTGCGDDDEAEVAVGQVPLRGDEQATLRAILDRHRDVVRWKLAGLDEVAVRRPMTPTGTNLLGLVRHLAAVEYEWCCRTFGRSTDPFVTITDDDPDGFLVAPTETVDDVLAYHDRARAAADAVLDALTLDAVATAWFGREVSLRWVLLHVIEEYARHAGHADIVRELLDGAVGEHPEAPPP